MSELLPGELGYCIPPEWKTHAGTLMHWPSNAETWPGDRMQRVENVYISIIKVLHRFESVHLMVGNDHVYNQAKSSLKNNGVDTSQIEFHVHPVNDVWARDCGPIFVQRSGESKEEFAITDWEYNAWGGKYPPYDDDNRIPAYFASRYAFKRFTPRMILEGGSIEVNGEGVLITTESVLLNPNRNPDLSKEQIEKCLQDYLGVKKIIWLKGGLAGDDTDGHVDDITRFLNDGTILTMTTDDPENVNHDILEANLEILQCSKDVSGNSFSIETLPMPETTIEGTTVDGSAHVPASYANFYIANDVVLVPTYDQRYDDQALALFRFYFPDRQVVGIPCADLVWGQGSIHCITQQLYGIESPHVKS